MVQYAVRFLIAAVVFVVFVMLLIPALLDLLHFPESAAVLAIVKGAAILCAIGYIIWGKPVPGAGNPA